MVEAADRDAGALPVHGSRGTHVRNLALITLRTVCSFSSMITVARGRSFERTFGAFERSIASAAKDVSNRFGCLFKDFAREYVRAREQRISSTPHLSVLQVFGLTTRELRHSDALAWFLREDAEHEQGDLFMRALLKRVGVIAPKRLIYTVEREKHGRIDVAAHAAGAFAVFMENKIRDRIERRYQFSDLVNSLVKFSDKNSIPDHARVAIFLTDDGRPPATAPTSKVENVIPCNLARVELFNLFKDELHRAPRKSFLLTTLLDSYLREIRHLN